MAVASDIFAAVAPFDPADPIQSTLAVPARWCVYCLADEAGRPVQMLCAKNARVSVRRRLLDDEALPGPSRRVDYRAIVRQIFYQRVDSELEQDLVYFDAARTLFPKQAKQMADDRPLWFVQIDLDSDRPRFVKTTDPNAAGRVFGPLVEKSHAGTLQESLEDLFDLCRYHVELLAAPAGRPCAYKDMKRCPAPCDGSVTLRSYHGLPELAVRALENVDAAVREQQGRMREAAAALRFEDAGAIKSYADGLASLSAGHNSWLQPIDRFAYVLLTAGPRQNAASVWIFTPTRCEAVLSLRMLDRTADGAVATVLREVERSAGGPIDAARFAVAAQRVIGGVETMLAVPLARWNDAALRSAMKTLAKIVTPEETDDAEDAREIRATGAAS